MMSTMFHTCFVCSGEIQEQSFPNSEENSLLLCQILEIPNLQNNLETFNDISYCPECLGRILCIRDMLEDLERLEKKILDEKYLIENQLKENSRKENDEREGQNNCSTDELRIRVGAELTAKTIQSMLIKIRKKQVDGKQCPQRPLRIMKDVTMPIIPTLKNRRSCQNSRETRDPVTKPNQTAAGMENGIFIRQESPIYCHESLPMGNYLEMQPDTGGDALEDPLHLSSTQTTWTDSDVHIRIKHSERNSYVLDACDDFDVDDIIAASEVTTDTSTGSASKSVKSEPGIEEEQFAVTKFTDAQGTDEGLGNTKAYICGTCGISFDRYNMLLIHDRVHMKAGSSSVVSKSRSKNTDITPRKKIKRSCKSRRRIKHTLQVRPSMRAKKCDECDQILSTGWNLKIHIMQVHRKEHKFKCVLCNFGCQFRSDLEDHMFIHSEVRNFRCHLCQKAFKQKRCLSAHLKLHK